MAPLRTLAERVVGVRTMTNVCLHCEERLVRRANESQAQLARRRFCSKRCSGQWWAPSYRTARIRFECRGCQKPVTRIKVGSGFCSQSCWRAWLSSQGVASSLENMMQAVRVAEDGCWMWMGHLGRGGYGYAKGEHAHRVMYRLSGRSIPTGLELDHLCRVPRCVNPDHMEPVTKAENRRRWLAVKVPATHCSQGHEYTPDNTRVTVRRSTGGSFRVCRTCARLKTNARRAARRLVAA